MLRRLPLLIVALAAGGCGFTDRFDRAEDRINAAVPIGPEVAAARAAVLSPVEPADLGRQALEREWANRLRVRAVTCSRGFAPTWTQSAAEVRRLLPDGPCFTENDRGLVRWLGLQRVRLILGRSPEKALPAEPARVFAHREPIQSIAFARDAPIAVARGPRTIAALDLTDGHELFHDDNDRASALRVEVSPNGRLFTQPSPNKVVVRGSARGETLVELPGFRTLLWLDDKAVLLQPTAGGAMRLLDLASGEDSSIAGLNAQEIQIVRPAPGAQQRYVLLGDGNAVQVEIVAANGRHEARTLAIQASGRGSYAAGNGGPTPDGKAWIDGRGELRLLSLDDLTIEQPSVAPLRALTAWPLHDAGTFLVNLAIANPGPGVPAAPRLFVYARGAGTLAAVSPEPHGSARFVWIDGLGRLGVIDGERVRIVDPPAAGEPRPLNAAIAPMLAEQNERRLAAASLLEATPATSAIAPLLPSLPADVQVEAVGVYEGAGAGGGSTRGPRVPGVVEIRVRRGARPIVLVLSSYEPVRWVLLPEPGVRLAAVLVSGYHSSTVAGAGSARVVQIGSTHAYGRDTPGFVELQRTVTRWTGQPIGVFQGRYAGVAFGVGG